MKRSPLFENGRKKRTPAYGSWRAMLQRCLDPKHESFRYYGGKGITVCERWRASFENFLADLGARPSPCHTLERPRGGNYEPGRVVWATWKDQAATRSVNHEALSAAGKKSASIKKMRKREAVERAGQLVFAAFS